MTTVSEWIDGLTKGHRFGTKNAAHRNNNIVGRFGSDTVLGSADGIYRFPVGTEYCIFRSLRSARHEVVATIYDGDTLVNIYAGGTIRRRPMPINAFV